MAAQTGALEKPQDSTSPSDAVKAELQDRFHHTDKDHPFLKELFEIATAMSLESLGAKSGEGLPLRSDERWWNRKDTPGPEISPHPIDPYDLVRQTEHLPSLPTIFGRLVDLMSNPASSSAMFASVIEKDTALSAKLLKLVNSPYYGFPSRIETISRAVTLVGTKELSALTLSMSVLTLFRNVPGNLVSMKSFWKHSIACGLVARKLAEEKGDMDSEPFFVGGLLHDVGRLILYMQLPEESAKTLSSALSNRILLFGAERRLFGFDHGRLGGLLLLKWRLPARLSDMVGNHHAPEKAADPLSAGILHLADIAVNGIAIGTSGEHYVPPLRGEAWKSLSLPKGTLKKTLERSRRQADELLRTN